MPRSAVEIGQIGGSGMQHFVVEHIRHDGFGDLGLIEDPTNRDGMMGGVEMAEEAAAFSSAPTQFDLFELAVKVLPIQFGKKRM